MIRSRLVMAWVVSSVLASGVALAADEYALRIGVTKYKQPGMSALKYPDEDAQALGELLPSGGTEVELLLGPVATQKAIREKRDALRKQGTAEGAIVLGPFGHGVEAENLLTNTLGMKLTLIPNGEFQMGSTDADIDAVKKMNPFFKISQFMDELPQHEVRITQPFYLGVHEVTKGQFAAFVKAQNYQTEAESDGLGGFGFDGEKFELRPEYTWRNPGFTQTDDHPVVNVDWNDAVAFCEWLSLKEGKTYQLPTEAQWEYACRAGTTTPFHFGSVNDGEKANINGDYPYGTETRGPNLKGTSTVGSYAGNAFGLYDMHGNAFEWCQDRSDFKAYASRIGVTIDPLITGTTGRILRGGSWNEAGIHCRSANRIWFIPRYRSSCLGFRVLRTVVGSGPLGQGF